MLNLFISGFFALVSTAEQSLDAQRSQSSAVAAMADIPDKTTQQGNVAPRRSKTRVTHKDLVMIIREEQPEKKKKPLSQISFSREKKGAGNRLKGPKSFTTKILPPDAKRKKRKKRKKKILRVLSDTEDKSVSMRILQEKKRLNIFAVHQTTR